MEVEMPECADVSTSKLLTSSRSSRSRASSAPVGRPFGRRLAKHALRLEVTADRRIRGSGESVPARATRRLSKCSCTVQPGMLVILRRQDLDGGGGEALEATEVAAQAIPQNGHRIGRRAGRVVPALDGRGAKATSSPDTGMPPGLGRQGEERRG
jgi:hypothetical protein